MILKTITSLSTLILLSGCIHRDLIINNSTHTQEQPAQEANDNRANTIIPRVAFPQSEYNNLAKSGKSTVKGKIYIVDDNGNNIYGKGTRLYLNPVTSYSKQWYNESYVGGYKMEKADKRLFNYLKFTTSNKRGSFAFFGIPSGSYYVIGVVKCGSECGYERKQNIRVVQEVVVDGNDIVSIDLSRRIN